MSILLPQVKFVVQGLATQNAHPPPPPPDKAISVLPMNPMCPAAPELSSSYWNVGGDKREQPRWRTSEGDELGTRNKKDLGRDWIFLLSYKHSFQKDRVWLFFSPSTTACTLYWNLKRKICNVSDTLRIYGPSESATMRRSKRENAGFVLGP